MLTELLSIALVSLWAILVTCRATFAELGTHNAPAHAPQPRGLEYRTIRRLPTGRIVALRLQVVYA